MESPFGSPEQWRHDDLIGVSRVFNEELALAAYECGAFPMPAQPGLMGRIHRCSAPSSHWTVCGSAAHYANPSGATRS